MRSWSEERAASYGRRIGRNRDLSRIVCRSKWSRRRFFQISGTIPPMRLADSSSPILQQLPRLDREPLCDPGDIVDRHVTLRALDRTEIGAVDAAFVRERFLAQVARSAQLAHV